MDLFLKRIPLISSVPTQELDHDERGFDARKEAIMRSLCADVYTDKSPKGSVDAYIVDLCQLINEHKGETPNPSTCR